MISRNQIKYIKDLSRKSVRNEAQQFVVEGEKLLEELIQSDFVIDSVFATPAWDVVLPDVEVTRITEKELERISQQKSPNKVVAVVKMPSSSPEGQFHKGITLFLDRINDPGNLGTIIRMADWFGVAQIVCTQQSVDVFNNKVIQSSMGSVFRVPVDYVDGETFLANYRLNHPENPVLGAAMEGEDLQNIAAPKNALIIMGSESHGIDENLEQFITQEVTIPSFGSAESLNVAVATGIILWEMKR